MMKKLIANIVGLFLLMTSLIACTEESTFDSDVHETGTITLGLNYKMLSRAAEEAGDDLYNENKIEKVDIFFYRGSDLNTCIFYPENVTLNSGEGTVTVKVPQEQLGLFESGTYSVYVIANGGFSRSELANKSVDQLKALSFTTDFLPNNGTPASFLMDGLSSGITLTKDGTSGQVDLYRAASKIVLTATVQDEIVGEDGTHYTPLMDGMYVSLYNGVKKTNVNTADKPYTVSTGDYFSTPDRAIKEKRNMGKDEKSGHVPFYSYATSWDENDNHETYLLLTVPWKVKSEEGESYTRYYYRVPINNQYKNLVRNNLYRINLSVAILGSTQKEDAVELNPNYLILNWSTEEINTELEDFKYLVLDENFKVMNNTPTCKIGYASSSEITSAKITYVAIPDYSQNLVGDDDDKNPNENIYIVNANSETSQIEITHQIPTYRDKNGKQKQIVVPYTMTLVVTNKDGFSESATIVQYPAIYIEAKTNSNYSGSGTPSGYGYAWVNNERGNTDYGYIGYLASGNGGSNYNPNMYVINVTTFAGSDYDWKIGDPRNTIIDNLSIGNDAVRTLATDGTVRRLSYYYPARSDASDVIAPSFRIASSYGQTSKIGFTTAKKRCAMYQEDGYPAGRWRVPTEAEIEFIAGLSGDGKIPYLFTRDYRYWASSGKAYENFTGTAPSSAYVRCVYDEWYWKNDKVSRETFTWGDKKR